MAQCRIICLMCISDQYGQTGGPGKDGNTTNKHFNIKQLDTCKKFVRTWCYFYYHNVVPGTTLRTRPLFKCTFKIYIMIFY